MSEKENGNNVNSGESREQPTQQQQGSEDTTESQPVDYPPTSVSFDDVDTVEKSQSPSEGDTVDLSQEDDSASQGSDPDSKTDDTE